MTIELTNGAIGRTVPLVDRFAIGLSALCVAHCLFMPLLLLALPSLTASILGGETMHLWLVYTVIPSSVFALSMGCKLHQRGVFMIIGLLGLSLLVVGLAVETLGLDHIWEKVFTVSGALVIAFAHVRNFQQCRESKKCNCEQAKI